MKEKLYRSVKKWGLSVTIICAGALSILLVLTLFNLYTEKTMEKLVRDNIEDMNRVVLIAINNNFDNFMSLLKQQAQIFNMLKNPSDEELMAKLVGFAKEEGYKNAAIITFDGKVFSSFRGITKVKTEDKLPNLNKDGSIISQPRIFHDGKLVIDISTPVYLDGINLGKLVISLDSDYLARMLPDNLLQGDAAFNLMTQDGTLITRVSQRESPLKPNSNIIEFYGSKDVQIEESALQGLINDLQNSRIAWIKYIYKENNTIGVSYMPLSINKWYIATAVTDGSLYTQSRIIQESAVKLTVSIMLIVIIVGVTVIIQRIKEQKRLDIMKNTYSIAIRKTNDLFYEADIDSDMLTDYSEQKDKAVWQGTPKKYSKAMEEIAGLCAPEFKEQFLNTFLPNNIRIKMEEGISSINFEYKVSPSGSSERWLSATFVPILDENGSTKLICMENDITEHVIIRERLTKSAMLDALTGLYNKITTQNYIEWFLTTDGKEGKHALAIIDIDNFKFINDNLGHAIGDEVIAESGTLLKKIFRKSDIVGRVGGDEFMVFMKDYGTIELIKEKMTEVRKTFRKDHIVHGGQSNTVKMSASVGIALYDKDAKSFTELYKAADIALYSSKKRGRDRITFFSPSLTDGKVY